MRNRRRGELAESPIQFMLPVECAGATQANGLEPAGLVVRKTILAAREAGDDSGARAIWRAVKFSREADAGSPAGVRPESVRPWFDRARRELGVGDVVVRRYAHFAPNQFNVLDGFEAEGWPPSVADAACGAWDAKRRARMKETVFRLNDGQELSLILFHCYPADRAILWESNGVANSNLTPTAGQDATAGEPILDGTVKPVFKKELREFWVGRDCVHSFSAQACNEVAILRKLQEKNWPPVIFDPLGNSRSGKYGAWLKTTVCRLNQCQSPWLIQFHSHPSERAVSWKWRLPQQQPKCNL